VFSGLLVECIDVTATDACAVSPVVPVAVTRAVKAPAG